MNSNWRMLCATLTTLGGVFLSLGVIGEPVYSAYSGMVVSAFLLVGAMAAGMGSAWLIQEIKEHPDASSQ